MTAGYSAFLFKQCRGRDLWQEPLLFPKLCLRALMLGAALGVALAAPDGHGWLLATVYLVATIVLYYLEGRTEHPNPDGRKAHAIFKENGTALRGTSLMMIGGMVAYCAAPSLPMVGAAVSGMALVLAFAGH